MQKTIDELAAMVVADQKVRWDWNEIRLDHKVDEATVARVKEEWLRVDGENLASLKVVFAEYGYPDKERFGKKASHDFWLLVQHCDQEPEFQLEVLTAMEPLLTSGGVNPGDYAYLYDRVHVNTGKLQRYGTQVTKREDGSGYQPKPLEAPELVDERRAKMGLIPLAEYLEQMVALLPIR